MMRRTVLCALFCLGVGCLSAKPPLVQIAPPVPVVPPAQPSAYIEYDDEYTLITADANTGDWILWCGVWGYGQANTRYRVYVYADDKFGGEHVMYPDDVWPVQPFHDWGKTHNGEVYYNTFASRVVKGTVHWDEIELHGTAKIRVLLRSVDEKLVERTEWFDEGKLTLP